jgi:hypothetical protein
MHHKEGIIFLVSRIQMIHAHGNPAHEIVAFLAISALARHLQYPSSRMEPQWGCGRE